MHRIFARTLTVAAVWTALGAAALAQQTAQEPFKPTVGQAGKDVVWVPTPESLVNKMLDMAQVTAQDYVIDLGSGDGRMVIAAAKRGARALGVEFNPEMVALSRRSAAEAGVADKATFVEGDMYTADISQATVMALFLLPTNLDKLKDKFLDLKPGTRIVLNTFAVTGWNADVTERLENDCTSWCTAMLYIVPAKVQGTWRMPQGELRLQQEFQTVSGTLTVDGRDVAIENGKMTGERITFSVNGGEYNGRVNGDTIEGSVKGGAGSSSWKATRTAQ